MNSYGISEWVNKLMRERRHIGTERFARSIQVSLNWLISALKNSWAKGGRRVDVERTGDGGGARPPPSTPDGMTMGERRRAVDW